MTDRSRPLLFVVSGPSGAGKGEALRFFRDDPALERVLTYTSRPPRPQEKDGRDYHFVSQAGFRALAEAGKLLEFNRTYGSHAYGSPRSLLTFSDDTSDQVLEMDPEGFLYLKANSVRRVIGIFVCPRSVSQLDERITLRAPAEDLQSRLATARRQIRLAPAYDFVVCNDSDIVTFQQRLRDVLNAVRHDASGREKVTEIADAISRSDVELL